MQNNPTFLDILVLHMPIILFEKVMISTSLKAHLLFGKPSHKSK